MTTLITLKDMLEHPTTSTEDGIYFRCSGLLPDGFVIELDADRGLARIVKDDNDG